MALMQSWAGRSEAVESAWRKGTPSTGPQLEAPCRTVAAGQRETQYARPSALLPSQADDSEVTWETMTEKNMNIKESFTVSLRSFEALVLFCLYLIDVAKTSKHNIALKKNSLKTPHNT